MILRAGALLERIDKKLAETNLLLRELISAQTGRSPRTLPSDAPVRAPRDGSAVSRVTRQDVIQRERQQQEQEMAVWRNGPDSAPTPSTSGAASTPGK